MALTNSILTITRRGEFRVDVVGPTHCGIQGGIFRYQFRADLRHPRERGTRPLKWRMRAAVPARMR